MKVLVTGAGALLGQGIIKSLRLAPSKYEILAVDPDARAIGLYWVDRAYVVPLATDPHYLDVIYRILEDERPDILLVGTDVELMLFATHKQQIESNYGVHVLVSSPEVIQIADDKWRTYQFLRANGFPYPESALPEQCKNLLARCGFPLIVKPRTGARSVGVYKVTNEQQLLQALAAVNDPIIQECVASPEEEYTSGVIVVDRAVKAVITMRRDLRDGNTYRAYVEPNAPYDQLLAEIAHTLGAEGTVNLQFRLDQGVPKIFEINARFSGTTPLRAYAGFNEVDYLVRYYINGEPIIQPQLSPVVILRYWDEIVVQPEQLAQLTTARQLTSPHFDHPFHLS